MDAKLDASCRRGWYVTLSLFFTALVQLLQARCNSCSYCCIQGVVIARMSNSARLGGVQVGRCG